jgi:hypothetical protein
MANSCVAELTQDFSEALMLVDADHPQAISSTTKKAYQPGIGPHTETATLKLVGEKLRTTKPNPYATLRAIRYPNSPRQECDWSVRSEMWGDVFVEVKMMRLMGDNGKPNDNILTHILSPYPQQRSALTDCEKLAKSTFVGRKMILIYGYAYEGFPLDPVMDAFRTLAALRVRLVDTASAPFDGLVHPIHRRGATYGWEIEPL